ncbi:trehalose operon repressor [Bombilactobacillus folatiphilus]|uniref:Trehalose operon repressor n=1 Tax=Bombilactobacillus folatiphilus TaxID=2923362 RepID=A0ABY4P8E8_9LACO|nr:trehalose operon repressor [Bombilactobacillus folatiphilus]UQS81892.1 trehalose operon repressor [Bombilactobacillus folatiphilus]
MHKINFIFNKLKHQIIHQIYPPNSLLPSENKLTQQYQVSRDTVRKALQLLQNQGYIQKQKGRGSIVLTQPKYPLSVSGIISYQEFTEKLHLDNQTQLISIEKTTLPTDEFISLGGVEPLDVIAVKRVRWIENRARILDIDYLNATVIPHISKQVAQTSLYQYIEQELELKISYAQKEITVAQSTQQDQQYLDLKPHEPVAVVKSITNLADTTPFQYTISRHCAFEFRFQDFARRY